MSYTNFQLLNCDLNFKLEVNFGSGWENWTANLFDISISQEPFTDTIAGLLTRQIEVRLEGLEPDIKWTKKNLPIRVYIYANSFEELLFNGLTKGGNSITGDTTTIRAVDETNRLLHTDFGSYATDNFRENDGQFLIDGDNEEGGTVFNTNYRPKPAVFETNQNIACYLKFNKNSNNESGLYTCDQMLKAMGVLGGFNKDGVFKIKKRVWTTPTSQWDLRNLQRADSFKDLYFSEDYFFNSIDVLGTQFNGQSINIHLNIQLGKRSQEISNVDISSNSNKNIFLENSTFENIYIGYLQTPTLFRTAYLNVQALNDEAEGSTALQDVYASPRAYGSVPVFNGTSHFGETATGFNFLDTANFAIEGWIRPEILTANGVIVTNRNASDEGQGVRLDFVNRRLQFVNHGIEVSSSNNNFFEWNESFHFLVSVNTTTKQVQFFKNGNLINTATYVNNLVASTERLRVGVYGATATQYFAGRLQELRIYSNTRGIEPAKRWHNRALINDGQTFNNTNDNLKGYWRFNEASGTTVTSGITGGQNITLNFSGRSTANLFTRLRAWQSSSLSFLGSYGNDNFSQTVRLTVSNDTGDIAYLKRAYLMAPGVYQKIDDIKENANNFTAGEDENKKELASFYINDSSYAQTLATNLLSIYGNNILPIYEFEVEIQPRLMVGDIITFTVYAPSSTTQNCIGVILEKMTSITTSPFKAVDILKVKKLRNL
jgi:hypothetical protein